MNTMRSTNMTSTSGVVLISFIGRSSSSTSVFRLVNELLISQLRIRREQSLPYRSTSSRGTRTGSSCRSRINTRTADQVGVQIGREVTKLFLDVLVATEQPVVAHDRRHRDEQTERGHDQSFTDRTCDLVQAG